VPRLEDLHTAAREELIEARLALGEHAEVLPELELLVTEHPFDERLRGQLMLALYSPDGSKILFTHFADDGTSSLWVINTNGTNARQLTPDSLQAGAGDWSPGGDRIAFANNDCGTCPASDIYVMNAAGQNVRPLTSNFANNLDPKWSPDGTQITFEHNDPPSDFSQQQIYTMNAAGTGLFNVTHNTANNFDPDWGVG
jgi:Tol biopolymer transport system component